MLAFLTAMFVIAAVGVFFLRRSLEPGRLAMRWLITALAVLALIGIARRAGRNLTILASLPCSLLMIFVWRRPMTELVGDWFGALYTGGGQELDPAPLYSMAEARRKQGHYAEAIEAVEEQLAQFPGDFTGLMLMAEIYAEDLKDLVRARESVQSIQSEPGISPNHVAYALGRQADWELHLAQDREAARSCLEEVVRRFPGTEVAQLALQRIAHLTPQEMLAGEQDPRPISLRPGEQRLGLLQQSPDLRPPEESPEAVAGQLVQQLERFPFDSDAREKLALVYARHYRRLDLAVDQLEQLIGAPGQTPKQVVHWLNLMADLQVDLTGDVEGARTTLQRIVEHYPKSAAAENALSRQAHLKLELRPQQTSRVVKLGSYEDNLGLKRASKPKQPPEDFS